MIAEDVIEMAADLVSQRMEEDAEDGVIQFEEEQPIILAYLLSNTFKLLTAQEKEYMLYLGMVIWEAVKMAKPETDMLSQDKIGEIEEINWARMQQLEKVRGFNKKLDAFFDGYEQEDLLAFIEDALADDEEELVTTAGKEYIFVALKTIVDALTDAQ